MSCSFITVIPLFSHSSVSTRVPPFSLLAAGIFPEGKKANKGAVLPVKHKALCQGRREGAMLPGQAEGEEQLTGRNGSRGTVGRC